MAYRVRFYMDMNAREAMHVIELRTAPQGHPSYRRICQAMHRAIADVAGHHAIADAMQFADHSAVELERLQQERALRSEQKSRRRRGITIKNVRPDRASARIAWLADASCRVTPRRRRRA